MTGSWPSLRCQRGIFPASSHVSWGKVEPDLPTSPFSSLNTTNQSCQTARAYPWVLDELPTRVNVISPLYRKGGSERLRYLDLNSDLSDPQRPLPQPGLSHSLRPGHAGPSSSVLAGPRTFELKSDMQGTTAMLCVCV